ncbi:MAG: energy-coupling factor transporter transmembrane component T family protein [Candidatus Izemoplasmataceae bacterium]
MKNIVIGQYVPGNSFLYRMDARSKLLALVVLMATAFIIKDFYHMIGMVLLVGFILVAGGLSVTRIMRGLKPVLILLLFTFSFQMLFVNTGELLYTTDLTLTLYNLPIMMGIIIFWMISKKYVKFRFIYLLLAVFAVLALLATFAPGGVISSSRVQIYSDGVLGAFFIMMRLIIIVTLSTILTLSTKPTDLNLGLERILKPLSIIKINAEEIAMIISIALRYIPTLLDEANKIMLAQASRGVDFKEGKFKDKIMQIISLLVPMFIISFKRSDELANAMEARNFVPGRNRTRLHVLKWNYVDTFVMIVVTLVFAISVVIRVVM